MARTEKVSGIKLDKAPEVVVDGRQLVSDEGHGTLPMQGFTILEYNMTETGVEVSITNSANVRMVQAGARALKQEATEGPVDGQSFGDFIQARLKDDELLQNIMAEIGPEAFNQAIKEMEDEA